MIERKSIFNINFPVFAVANSHKRLWSEDNILYIQTDSGVYVLDNKNIEGKTLGQRRLRITNSTLYNTRKVVHTIAQLTKSKYTTFVDNTGIPFKYFKHTVTPLKYFKVIKVRDTPKGCVLHFKNLDNPILVSCREAYGIKYVGFLITKVGYILYDYSDEFKADTWRKI